MYLTCWLSLRWAAGLRVLVDQVPALHKPNYNTEVLNYVCNVMACVIMYFHSGNDLSQPYQSLRCGKKLTTAKFLETGICTFLIMGGGQPYVNKHPNYQPHR